MARLNRRDLFVAAASGTAGGAGRFFTHRYLRPIKLPRGATLSYSEYGEDVIIQTIFYRWGRCTSYLDIGAWGPQTARSTYLLYARGA
jgi:hypothetical protein